MQCTERAHFLTHSSLISAALFGVYLAKVLKTPAVCIQMRSNSCQAEHKGRRHFERPLRISLSSGSHWAASARDNMVQNIILIFLRRRLSQRPAAEELEGRNILKREYYAIKMIKIHRNVNNVCMHVSTIVVCE